MVRRKGRGAAADAVLAGYVDLEEIGGGAFATVFRAVEAETGRPVALKILKVDTIHAHLIETFHHEIQALAAVSDHPNIVTLYRPSTTADGRPVLVLELCRESLGQQLRANGPLGAPEVTAIGIKIAGALETAHRNGFLHRDMKPQNILITQFGEPALADFGVAALQASAQMTAGVFGFTTLHAAPEMLEGHHLSPATDVYGLASTMYQLLTGQAPFATFENEAPASVILRILRDPVRPLRAEHIPLDLADLLEAALSKEPEGRPRTAAEFAQGLKEVEAANGWPETAFVAWGEEGLTPPPTAVGRGPMGVMVEQGPEADVDGSGGSEVGVATESGAGGREDVLAAPAGEAAREAGGGGEADAAGGGRSDRGPDVPVRSTLPPLLPPSTPPEAPAAGGGPAPPARPALVTPETGPRTVVQPLDAVRGRFGPPAGEGAEPAPGAPGAGPAPAPGAPSGGRLGSGAGRGTGAGPGRRADAPLWGGSPAGGPPAGEPPAPSASRPTFIDPDPSERSGSTSVYEETMGVHQLYGPPGRRPPAASPPAAQEHWSAYLPMWAIAALVVAVLVIVAAILVLAGVI